MSDKRNRILCGVSSFGSKQIKLQSGESGPSLIKHALIVFEGTHQGMFGPVTLSKDFLKIMVDRFNREFANPKNENDYPPLLRDHSRSVEDVLGRMLPPLVLEDFENPRTGETVAAIFGDLRIDDADAQAKVLSGKYSQVSLSFDDDPNNLGEIFESSIVAVEAARGSQILTQGENMDLAAKLSQSQSKVTSLKAKLSTKAILIKETRKSLSLTLKSADTQAKELGDEIATTVASLRIGVVKAQLKGYVKEGKLTKAEFDKIDLKAIATAGKATQDVLLSAYAGRTVSTDVEQIGSTDSKPLDEKSTKKQLSAADTRELVKAQRENRKPVLSQVVNLNVDDEKEDVVLTDDNKEKDVADSNMTMDDIEDALTKLEGLSAMRAKLTESISRLSETLKSLQDDDDKDNEEEEVA